MVANSTMASDRSAPSPSTTSRSRLPGLSPFAALRERNYRFIFSAQVFSLWAMEMEALVLAWFVLSDTGSPLQLGLIGAARFGGIFLSPIYGAIVDRFNRRSILLIIRGYNLALAIAFATLVLTDSLVVWHAYVLVSIGSVGRMLGVVTNDALTADAVDQSNLSSAMGLLRGSLDISRVLGSLLGGILLASIGLGTAYVAITILYAISAGVAFGITVKSVSGDRVGSTYLGQIVDGIAYVRTQSMVAALLFYTFLTEFTVFPMVNDLMLVVARDLHGLDADGAGVMRAVASGGALTGSILAGSFRNTLRPGRALILLTIVWHLITLAIAPSPYLGLTLVLFFAWGVFGGAAFVMLMLGLLAETPSAFRGRVLGLRGIAIFGLPAGLVLGGWLAQTFSVEVMLVTHSLIGLGMVALAYLLWPRLWGMRLQRSDDVPSLGAQKTQS
jgi:predicted MFS family arabinose efflux permease